jgi:redox-sensitive bicupin YhaK (pirin superfamily)
MKIRRSKDRGHINHGWLEAYHSFSFGEYIDFKFKGYRNLRVINEDRVQANKGFSPHSHHDMEIITYIIEGALSHKDSMGNGSTILPHDVQYMSAGSSVTHSEVNEASTGLTHLLQIWILPNDKNLTPRYDQRRFSVEQKKNKFCLVASLAGEEGSISIRQDIKLFASILEKNKNLDYELQKNRYGWLQLISGELKINGEIIVAGDGIAFDEKEKLAISSLANSEFLFFDLN